MKRPQILIHKIATLSRPVSRPSVLFLVHGILSLAALSEVQILAQETTIPNGRMQKSIMGQCVAVPKQVTRNSTISLALHGERVATLDLMPSDDSQDIVPLRYLAVLCAQNGYGSDLFARQLFWSGNPYNQVRASYWVKARRSAQIKAVLIGGLVFPKDGSLEKYKEGWLTVFAAEGQNQIVCADIKLRSYPPREAELLREHAVAALCGSVGDARSLWEYYYQSYLLDRPILSVIGFDWLYVFHVGLMGFPGANASDKFLYWLIVAAENGDPEAQWRLSRCFDPNDEGSVARKTFWENKSKQGGYQPPKK